MAGLWDKLKQKMEGGGYQPSEAAWQNMQERLDAHPEFTKTNRAAYWYWGRVAAGLALLATLSWFGYNQWTAGDIESKPQTEQQPITNQETQPAENNTPEKLSNPSPQSENPIADETNSQKENNTSPASHDEKNIAASADQPVVANTNTAPKQAIQQTNPISNSQNAAAIVEKAQRTEVATLPQEIIQYRSIQDLPQLNQKVTQVASDLAGPQLSKIPFTNRGLSNLHLGSVSALYTHSSASAGAENNSGFGVEAQFDLGNWHAAVGLINQSVNSNFRHKIETQRHSFDTSRFDVIHVTSRQVVDSTWIVLGVNKGIYVYDTTYHNSYDTSTVSRVDTSYYLAEEEIEQTITLGYSEVPVHIGYSWRINRFELSLRAGVNLGMLTQQKGRGEDFEISNDWMADASLQAGLRYYLNSDFSLLVRPTYRQTLVAHPESQRANSRVGAQWGLTYHL